MDSIYEHAISLAMKNSSDVGYLLGIIGHVLRWGELGNRDYKTLAQAYIKIVGENEFNRDDVVFIRTEADRRGIVLG